MPRAQLKVKSSPDRTSIGGVAQIDRNPYVIGRTSHVLFKAQQVSRQHARISFRNGNFYIEDTGSANGTFLNGQRLPPNQPQPLRSGMQINLSKQIEVIFEMRS